MAKPSLSEQLDQAIDAILARPNASLPGLPQRIAPLARLALELRALPRDDFRLRLRGELQKEANKMTEVAERKFAREGFRTITPYLVVRQAEQLIEFVKTAFGAEGSVLGIGSEGGLHAEYKIGDSMLMMGGGSGLNRTPMPTSLHYYVPDVDATYRRALDAGAKSLMAPVDQSYGDREAAIEDVAGNHWYIATHTGAHYMPEGLHSIQVYLHPRGAASLVDFLVRGLGAEVISRHEAPDGSIAHAGLRIGDSVLEMGEAHGPWQPMPTMFFLYVPDADAWYRRAVDAGAASLAEPADQPYGDRTAGVTDPAGNQWYFATRRAADTGS